jgi:hypothetical protein
LVHWLHFQKEAQSIHNFIIWNRKIFNRYFSAIHIIYQWEKINSKTYMQNSYTATCLFVLKVSFFFQVNIVQLSFL